MPQLSIEQLETYERPARRGRQKLRTLNEAQAQAAVQRSSQCGPRCKSLMPAKPTSPTRKQAEQAVVVEADADLAQAKRQAEQIVLQPRLKRRSKCSPARVRPKVMQVGVIEGDGAFT